LLDNFPTALYVNFWAFYVFCFESISCFGVFGMDSIFDI